METGKIKIQNYFGITFFTLVIACSFSACATSAKTQLSPSTAPIEISLVTKTEKTKAAKDELLGLLNRYDLSPFFFTKTIQIQTKVIPHSHPTLTLNTRHIGHANETLTAFLHEQIHWYLDDFKRQETDDAIKELRKLFPQVPSDTGARDEESIYLHLVVCWMELQADKHYLGDQAAYQLFRDSDVYAWINQKVLEHEKQFREIYERLNIAEKETGLPMIKAK